MSYLIGCLRRERERPPAFHAVGLYAIAVKAEIKRHIPNVMSVIRYARGRPDHTKVGQADHVKK
jgi:hypothetical protein